MIVLTSLLGAAVLALVLAVVFIVVVGWDDLREIGWRGFGRAVRRVWLWAFVPAFVLVLALNLWAS